INLKEGVALSNTTGTPGTTTDIFTNFTGAPFVNNEFDPLEENTFNYSTSTTIYDSLGNSHVLTKYFVKEPKAPNSPDNLWTMHVLIDNVDVGDPLVAGGEPTRASFSLVFNEDGTFNEIESDEVLISNWKPLGVDG